MKTFDHLSVIGLREWIALPDLGIVGLRAKIDTGASTSTAPPSRPTYHLPPILAAQDADLGPGLASRLSDPEKDVAVVFDPDPAPISGGLWLVAENGAWRSLSDWSVVVRERSELVARRLMAIL